jgi:hypothetical protein
MNYTHRGKFLGDDESNQEGEMACQLRWPWNRENEEKVKGNTA